MDTKTYDDFVSLVRRMREYQQEHMRNVGIVGSGGCDKNEELRNIEIFQKMIRAEFEVDEYLKKMEDLK